MCCCNLYERSYFRVQVLDRVHFDDYTVYIVSELVILSYVFCQQLECFMHFAYWDELCVCMHNDVGECCVCSGVVSLVCATLVGVLSELLIMLEVNVSL